jgi:hypothetical protein
VANRVAKVILLPINRTKIVRRANFLYTLYKDDNGSFVLDLIISSAKNASVNYEKRVVFSAGEKILIKGRFQMPSATLG